MLLVVQVAAQIVAGIGFLGAGAILHSRTTVSGMTTATSVWITAAIGVHRARALWKNDLIFASDAII